MLLFADGSTLNQTQILITTVTIDLALSMIVNIIPIKVGIPDLRGKIFTFRYLKFFFKKFLKKKHNKKMFYP